MTSKQFGQRLLFARTHFGTMQRELTQDELAKLSGIASTKISNYERGVMLPSVPNLIKLSRALGCTTDWMLNL